MVRPPDPFDFSDYSRPQPGHGGPPDPGVGDFTRSSGGFNTPPAPNQHPGMPTGDSFSGAGASTVVQVRTAPTAWLAAAGAVATIGLIVAVVAFVVLDSGPVAVVAWILGGPVAIGLLALFTYRDTQARASAFYTEPLWVSSVTRVVLAISCIAVLISAWNIADWIGRL
ncbi:MULTISPECIES: hypothetical protein [Rhodococcus]|uniref:Uncharacterized protein n=2 Tax=Nocardiaceae TaxID=85025 RepID=A0A652YJJ9_NOCGL|nr:MULTISPECIES: hypothetical protein [Rhodococcus]KJF19590.1 hypothetical protein SZ00_06014 [Rhodococcus sp. AD45]NMD63966.1 hypothetical protein [Nocardia globerula]PVX66773.1 hypothetical protein C8E04_4114 [Rhodococcus globerulus]